MKFRRFGAALGVVAALAMSAAPAHADNYDVKDGQSQHQLFAAKLFGFILYPIHVMAGMFGSTPTPVNMTTAGALDVNVVAGGAGGGIVTQATPASLQATVTQGPGGASAWKVDGSAVTQPVSMADLRPASGNITAADAASTTTAGQGGVTLVNGSPTANSSQAQAISGYSSGSITVTGTFVGALAIEASYDGGTTYAPVSGLLRGTSLTTASITGPAVVSLDVTGATHLRVRATSFTSGTAAVKMAFSSAAGMTKILNGVKLVDSAGSDATDTTNHAVKVNVVAGAVSASTTATAASTPPAVTAGTGKALGEGLFSNLFITPVTPGGAQIDLSAPSGIFGIDGATIMSLANPLATQNTAGEAHIGEVGGNQFTVQSTPTVTAVAYTSGWAVGGLQTLANAGRVSGGAGLLQDVTVLWKSTQTSAQAAMDIFLFSDTSLSSTCTNAAAFVLSSTDSAKLVGVIHVTDTTAGNTTTMTQALNLAKTYRTAATTLYACAVTRGTPTLGTTSDLIFSFNFVR